MKSRLMKKVISVVLKKHYPHLHLVLFLLTLIIASLVVFQLIPTPVSAQGVNEYDIPPCRWSKSPGQIKYLSYNWGPNLAPYPNALWRIAFQSSVSDWNNTSTPFWLYETSSSSPKLDLDIYWQGGGSAGFAQPTCSGSTTTHYAVRGNAVYYTGSSNYNRRRSVTGHELGHGHSVGHIDSTQIALLGYNPDPNVYYTPQSIDVQLIQQVYP